MKPTLTPENRKIVNRALRNMLAMPETYRQRTFIDHNPRARPSRQRPAPFCGTVCCIAGHIALASGLSSNSSAFEIWKRAAEIVGEQGVRALFEADLTDWPQKFAKGWSRLDHVGKAARAVARTRQWLMTGR